MTRVVTGGLIVLPFLGLLAATAAASTEFEDIPFLQVRINQVLEREPTGAEVEWHNEATGNSGVIRVLKTYFPEPGAPCRDYERSTREPGGDDKLVRGTGCRDASGRWNLKEQEDAKTPEAGSWSPVTPSEGAKSPAPSGGQAGGAGGQGGAQTTTAAPSGGGSSAGAGASPTGQPTPVAPKASRTEAATEATAAAAAQSSAEAEARSSAEAAEPAAAKPAEPPKPSEPSPPVYDLPTRSD